MNMYHDEQSVHGRWEKGTLTIFKFAIIKYIECLQPLNGEGNHIVNKEIEDWQEIQQTINREIKQLTDEREQGELPMYGKNYGKLLDILSKHYGAKKQLLEERKRIVLEEAAHQGATKKKKKINIVLGLGFWEHINRKRCLVESFYPKEEPKKEQQSVAMQITIGNLYGQFAAFNNGAMVQNNNSEAVTALREITDALISSKLQDDEKQEALLDVEAMQSQLKKDKPNRRMLEIGLESLQVAANTAQIYQAIQPHFHTILEFLKHLPKL